MQASSLFHGKSGWYRSSIVWILALAAILFLAGIRWGLPQAANSETVQPWALDTIAPIAPMNEAYYRFTRSGNEFVVYPLFHYAVLATAYAPYVAIQFATGGFSEPSAEFPYGVLNINKFAQDLTLIARLVSVAMALGIVLILHRITHLVAGRSASNWTAMAVCLVAPLSYYAKTSNLDVPYVFWTILAIWRFLHILKKPENRDFILLGIFAALAVATKDQAYGFFLLIPPMLCYRLVALEQYGQLPSGWRWLRTIISTQMLLGGVAAIVTYATANNLFFGGLDGWIRHLSYGGELYEYRSATEASFYTIRSQLQLLGESGLVLLRSLGPATMLITGYGIYLAVRDRRYGLLSLLVIAISYYIFVIAVFNLVFSRYLLAIMLLLLPFFGLAASRVLDLSGHRRKIAVGLLTIALSTQALFVVNLHVTLIADSRYAMANWIDENVPHGSHIESQVRQRMLPQLTGNYQISVAGNSGDPITMLEVPEELTPQALASRNPDYILFLEGLGVTGDPAGWETESMRDYYQGLISGEFGYEIVARFPTPYLIDFRQIPGTRPNSILLARVQEDTAD